MGIPRHPAICITLLIAIAVGQRAGAFTFDDEYLKRAFNKALGQPPDHEPNIADMARVKVLAASNPDAACLCGGAEHTEHFDGLIQGGLGGIQYATTIEELYLEGHCRTAIDKVGGLTSLKRLSVRCNLLDNGNLSSLTSLRGLEVLRLGYNEDITSIDSLLTSPASLPALRELDFHSCNVSDISRLKTAAPASLRLINMQDNPLNVDAYRVYIPALVTRLGQSGVLCDPPRCLQVLIDGEGSVRLDDHDSTDHMTLNRPWYHPKAPQHEVRLQAAATAGWRFDRWEGGASGTNPDLTVTMDCDRVVHAYFIRATCTLTVTSDGCGSVTGGGTFDCGSSVPITATVQPCYRFVNWTGTGDLAIANPNSPGTTVTVNGDGTVTAHCAAQNVTLTTGVNPPGGGTVTRSPDRPVYNCGEQVTLTAAANQCYRFTDWSGSLSGSANPVTVTLSGDKNITANFAIQTYTLTASSSGCGTVTRTPDAPAYNCNEQVVLTAVPGPSCRFMGWSGDASGTGNPITITMDRSKNVVADFARTTCTLTINAANGTVTRTPDKALYDCGETAELKATADACHEFTGWSGDASGTANPLTITMDRSKTITAGFKEIGYTVQMCHPVGGSVDPSPGTYTYDCGTRADLLAAPDAGYRFKQWAVSGEVSVDCVSCPTSQMMVNGDGSVCAEFEKMGGGAPRKMIAILDVAEDSGTTKRAVCYYDVNDLRTAQGRVFDQKPLFSVWTGYADSLAKRFEDTGAIAVNPINGTVYVLAMDAGTPGQLNAATRDFSGDYDLYRIDYQGILNDFVANHRARGTMYAPKCGPDYDGTCGAQVDHPDHKGKTVFLDGAIEKIAELARNQGTSLFDYDLAFVNPARLVVLDNEKDSDVDAAPMDHSFRAFNRLSLDPAAAGGAAETWDARELGLVNLDFDAAGKPAGRSEPIGIQYYLDPPSGVAGLWVVQSNGGGDTVAFFEITNWTGPVGNRYRPYATGAGPVLPTTFAIDDDPILSPGAFDGRLDWIRTMADGSLLLGESGSTDIPKGEPKVLTRQVVNYADAKSRIVLGPWSVAGPIHPSKDDDTAVTGGDLVAYDKGENLVYFFDAEEAPGAVVDVYVFDLNSKEMVYEELDAVDHSIKRHGIELFLRGDIDQDGRVDASDVAALRTLVAAGPDPVTSEMYDLTGDRRLDPADISELAEGILGTPLADPHLAAPVLTPDLQDAHTTKQVGWRYPARVSPGL